MTPALGPALSNVVNLVLNSVRRYRIGGGNAPIERPVAALPLTEADTYIRIRSSQQDNKHARLHVSFRTGR
jgi:hypothetical protein